MTCHRQFSGVSNVSVLGERERFGWNAALVVTVGDFSDFEKWSREELALKDLYLKDRDDLLRYLDGYKR